MRLPSRRDSRVSQLQQARVAGAATSIPVLVALLVGVLLGRWSTATASSHWCSSNDEPTAHASPQQATTTISTTSFVTNLSQIPVRTTAHVDVTKQQLMEPFAVPNLAGISVATIHPGQSVELHAHKTMHEFFYILNGSAIFTIEHHERGGGSTSTEQHTVQPGYFAYCRAKDKHAIHDIFAYCRAKDKHAIHVLEDSPDGDLKVLLMGVVVE